MIAIILPFENNLNMDIEKTFDEQLAEKDLKIKDAEENFGETEVRDALLAKAELYQNYSKFT